MTNLRRLMVVVLAVVMIATSMATAFGAPLSDISGKKYEDSVNKLVSLGVAAGIDGQFKGEDKLTRAEFATFIVNMMGLGKQDQVDTIFSDATAKDWFSGYVNAVNEAGYMVGSDGKFNPTQNVTYGEAITVLMKMIGYAPVVNNRGTWPSNYVSRAGSIKLTKDVSVSASAPVTRGNLAILLWNTLTIKPLVESGTYDEEGNPTYTVSSDVADTLLFKNFNETKEVKEAVVTDIPLTSSSYANNEIKINGDWFVVPSNYDPNAYLGLEVTYVADKDNNIKWIGSTTDSKLIIEDTLKEYALTSGGAISSLKFKKLDQSFLATSNARLFYNGKEVTASGTNIADVLANAASTAYTFDKQDVAKVRVILNDDNQIVYAFLTQDVPNTTVGGVHTAYGLVTANGATVKGKGTYNFDKGDLNDKAKLGISKNIVYRDGQVAKLNDIKVGDLIRETDIPNGILVNIYTPTINTVKIDSLEDVTDLSAVKLVAGDKTYQLGGTAYYSDNNGTDKNPLTLDNLSKFLGYDGTKLYVGPSGKVAYIENAVAPSDFLYGVVVKKDDSNVTNSKGDSAYKLSIFKPDGSTATYVTKDDQATFDAAHTEPTLTVPSTTGVLDKLVAYKLSTKNEITFVGTSIASGDQNATRQESIKTISAPTATGIVGDDNYIQYAGGQAAVTTSTVFVNMVKPHAGTTAADVETVDWDVVKADTSLASVDAGNAKVAMEKGVAKVVFLNETAFGTSSKYGVVVGSGYSDGERTIKINKEGVVKEYTVSNSAYMTYAVKGLLVNYSISGDDITTLAQASIAKSVDSVNQSVYYKRPGTGDYINGNGVYNDNLIVGKVTNLDTANSIISFKGVKNKAGDTNDPEIAITLPDDLQIYDIRDVNKITYTEDISVLENGRVFVFDNANDILLIVKTNADYQAQSQVDNGSSTIAGN